MPKAWKVYLVLLLLLVVRVATYFFFVPSYKGGEEIELVTRLESEPTVSQGRQVFRTSRFFVSAPKVPVLHYNDLVRIEGLVKEDSFLQTESVLAVENYRSNFFEQSASKIRDSFIQSYQKVLVKSQANLLSGVVLGSIGLDSQFKAKLAEVGVTHIIAASGMNITLFSGFVSWLLRYVRLQKIYKAILSMLFIVFYSTITGFAPPIVRAALMAGFVLVANLFGRQGSGVWGLIISAYVMLWVSPALATSASFLLSFFAMIGQIFLGAWDLSLPGGDQKVIDSKGLFAWLRSGLLGNFWQSFLAIIFTLPILLWFFGKFSLVSLLSNMLILWTVEPLMILGGLIGVLGMVSQDLAQIAALPAGPLLAFFLGVVDALSGKDYFLVNWQISNWLFPVGYYLFLGGGIWWWAEGRFNNKD